MKKPLCGGLFLFFLSILRIPSLSGFTANFGGLEDFWNH
jgi:hypothetical protein